MTTLLPSTTRDDRILPETHITAGILVPILSTAFVILYIFPGRTGQLFAWTIRPRMTPMIMGAGYVSGAYFFSRLFLGRHWHRFSAPLPGIATFASLMLLATLLHWDRFNHDHISFIAWFITYVITPFLVLAIWLRNRTTDPATPDDDDIAVSRTLRVATALIGVAVIIFGALVFISPQIAIDHAPWSVSPLTGRVLAGWIVFPGVISLVLATDPRWSSWRVPMEGTLVWVGLIVLAIPRAWDNFHGGVSRTIFIAAILVWFVAVIAFYAVMEARRMRRRAAFPVER